MGVGYVTETVNGQAIMIVEDEPIVRDVVRRYLSEAGFRVVPASDGAQAQTLFAGEPFALVVLDVMLPVLDGLELCRWIRGRSSVPIIMLTARGDETDRIVGLELGADDYVTKPFSPRELTARVKAVLRRGGPSETDGAPLVFDDLEIDPVSREVRQDGRTLHLTAREFDLLYLMAENPRKVFERDRLMERVWGYESALDTGTLTVHIRRLREKIERDASHPRHLETVWGVGYRFVP